MPELLDENTEAYALAQRALPWSIDGMGSLNPQGIEAALASVGIEKGTDEYDDLWAKVSHYIQAWYAARRPPKDGSNDVEEIKKAVGKENVKYG